MTCITEVLLNEKSIHKLTSFWDTTQTVGLRKAMRVHQMMGNQERVDEKSFREKE